MSEAPREIGDLRETARLIEQEVGRVIVGQETVVRGVVIALLTAPKAGAETREELAARAQDAAEAAREWIPVNVPSTNGKIDPSIARKAQRKRSTSTSSKARRRRRSARR